MLLQHSRFREASMEPAAILEELARCDDDLPREALRSASERRAEMVPLFLEEIERFVSGSAAEPIGNTPLFLIFHLLGEWRETSAYHALARLLRSPPEHLDAAISDAITMTAHHVMAAVFDGDPQPIYNIILDQEADEFVRSRMCETLAILVVGGRLGRDEVAAFLRDCWIGLQPRDCCFVWHGWQSSIAALGLVELKEIVKEAFDRRIVSPGWLSYGDFESDLAYAVSNPSEPWPDSAEDYRLFGNTIDELSAWYDFSDQREPDRESLDHARLVPLFPPPEPLVNPMRGVGRNHPCPCGSGKKYKKCCLP
jgi:hypothetical protein